MICFRCGCEYSETVAACPMCGASPERPPEAEAAEKSSATVEISKDEIRDFEAEKSAQPVRYGGFWIRCWAAMLDGVVLGLVSLLIYGAGMIIISSQYGEIGESVKALLIPQLVSDALMKAFYFIYFHAVTGQTVGKKALGLKVVGQNGQSIGWARSAGRYFGSFISLLVFGLGYLWVAFDDRKQSWHDKMAGSFVVRV
jgi:uncharacterized RDD family membrane protein YckC